MKPNLYICHTAYQVLVDLLRASRTDGQPHTMVLSAAVPEPQSLAKKLEATGAVKVVIVDETRWPGTVTGPFAARRARRPVRSSQRSFPPAGNRPRGAWNPPR